MKPMVMTSSGSAVRSDLASNNTQTSSRRAADVLLVASLPSESATAPTQCCTACDSRCSFVTESDLSLLLDYDDDSPRNNNHLSDLKCATGVCIHCGISGIIGAVARHQKGLHDNKGGQIKRMLLELQTDDEKRIFPNVPPPQIRRLWCAVWEVATTHQTPVAQPAAQWSTILWLTAVAFPPPYASGCG